MDKFENNHFQGCLLLAAPHMIDGRFKRSVIYICKHDKNGAMGLIVNRQINEIHFGTLLQQFKLESDEGTESIPVFLGGPVDNAHGFILHSTEYECKGTLECGACKLSSSVHVLRDIASGQGPQRFNVTLGYAGWNAGQLEDEIIKNDWLVADADTDIVFDHKTGNKWNLILQNIGISNLNLSSHIGHS